jgi:hypothetical protein
MSAIVAKPALRGKFFDAEPQSSAEDALPIFVAATAFAVFLTPPPDVS